MVLSGSASYEFGECSSCTLFPHFVNEEMCLAMKLSLAIMHILGLVLVVL